MFAVVTVRGILIVTVLCDWCRENVSDILIVSMPYLSCRAGALGCSHDAFDWLSLQMVCLSTGIFKLPLSSSTKLQVFKLAAEASRYLLRVHEFIGELYHPNLQLVLAYCNVVFASGLNAVTVEV